MACTRSCAAIRDKRFYTNTPFVKPLQYLEPTYGQAPHLSLLALLMPMPMGHFTSVDNLVHSYRGFALVSIYSKMGVFVHSLRTSENLVKTGGPLGSMRRVVRKRLRSLKRVLMD